MIDVTALEAERDFLLQEIEDLDREHVAGTLNDAEYIDLRDQQVVRAARVLRSIQDLRAQADAGERVPGRAVRAASWVNAKRRTLWTTAVLVLVLVAGFGLQAVVQERQDGATITGSSPADVTALLANAQKQTSQGDAAGAVRTYDRVLQADPSNVQALTYRGWLLRLAGLSQEGLASIERAIAVDATYADPHFFKGYILLNDQQQPAAAAAEFRTFLASNPPQDLVPLVQQALKDADARAAVASSTPSSPTTAPAAR